MINEFGHSWCANCPLDKPLIKSLSKGDFAFYIRSEVDEMNDEYFDLYLKYHFATCEREDMVGLSAHTLDILRKN